MDISFHYYAVKSIARAAGYEEVKAQRIATFSQFIDDYNWYAYFKANNIPDYVKASKYDIVFNEFFGIINPVTTGFYDYFDLATLLRPRSQKYTDTPFHFIPQDRISSNAGDNRTVPAVLNDNSYIANMLNEIKAKTLAEEIPESDSLMQIGAVLHTFADTYAHQLFTGFYNRTNSIELKSVTNNINGEDQTEYYRFWLETCGEKIEEIIGTQTPPIGHMFLNHIPDLSHLSFSMEYQDLQGDKHIYTRSNTETFVKASRQIYDFLRSCLEPSGIPANMKWDDLSPKLAEGFLIDASKELDSEKPAVAKLTPHWSSIFPEYSYLYSRQEIKEGFILSSDSEPDWYLINGEKTALFGKSYSDDFYKFNVYADEMLIKLYGNHPRNLLSEENVEIKRVEPASN